MPSLVSHARGILNTCNIYLQGTRVGLPGQHPSMPEASMHSNPCALQILCRHLCALARVLSVPLDCAGKPINLRSLPASS